MKIEAKVMAVPVPVEVEFGPETTMEQIRRRIIEHAREQIANNGVLLEIVDCDLPELIDGWAIGHDHLLATATK